MIIFDPHKIMDTRVINFLQQAALAGMCLLFIYSLWNRIPNVDDAWIGEHAYWISETGHARSGLMHGITQQEDYLIIHHKLLTLQGALFIKVFGFSLPILKSVSLLYFILFLILFTSFVKKNLHFKRDEILASLLILVSFPWIFEYAFVFRPEIMAMFFGFFSYILLHRYLGKDGHKWLPVALSGLAAGLAITTHLNGIVFAGSGVVLLLSNRRLLPSLVFLMAVIAGVLPYFFDFNAGHGFDYWLYQFKNSPSIDIESGIPVLLYPAMNLAREHMRFFHNPFIASFTVLAIVTISLSFKQLYRTHRNLMIYAISLVLLLGMTAIFKTVKYIILEIPFLTILLILAYRNIMDRLEHADVTHRMSRAYHYLVMALFIAYLGFSAYLNVQLSFQKFTADQNSLISRKYVKENPNGLKVIAPMTFVFNEITKFSLIQSEMCYAEMLESDPSIKGEGFFRKALQYDIDYVFISPVYRYILGISIYEEGDAPSGYMLIDKTNDLVVFRREDGSSSTDNQ